MIDRLMYLFPRQYLKKANDLKKINKAFFEGESHRYIFVHQSHEAAWIVNDDFSLSHFDEKVIQSGDKIHIMYTDAKELKEFLAHMKRKTSSCQFTTVLIPTPRRKNVSKHVS